MLSTYAFVVNSQGGFVAAMLLLAYHGAGRLRGYLFKFL